MAPNTHFLTPLTPFPCSESQAAAQDASTHHVNELATFGLCTHYLNPAVSLYHLEFCPLYTNFAGAIFRLRNGVHVPRLLCVVPCILNVL